MPYQVISSGSSKRLKNCNDWDKEMKQYEVIVMTPQILLHHLSHYFITMDSIALLIFDKCHHAQANSNHPYAEIMKMFYKKDGAKLPLNSKYPKETEDSSDHNPLSQQQIPSAHDIAGAWNRNKTGLPFEKYQVPRFSPNVVSGNAKIPMQTPTPSIGTSKDLKIH